MTYIFVVCNGGGVPVGAFAYEQEAKKFMSINRHQQPMTITLTVLNDSRPSNL